MLPSSGVSAIKSRLSLCPVPGWLLRLRTRHKAKRHRKRRGCNPWITLKGWERKGSFSKCPVCTQVAPSNEHVSKFGAFCFWKKIPKRWDYCLAIRFGINERKLDLHLPTNTLKESESVSYSVVSNSATPCTVAHQVPLSMGFSRQEYRSRLPFPPPGNLPNPGIDLGSPTLQATSLPSEPLKKPK